VKVVDLNLLLYAVNSDAPHHERARAWWEALLESDEQVGLAWVVILGFLRLSTRPGVFPSPLTPNQALDVVDSWLGHPSVATVGPTARHWPILRGLIGSAGTAGSLTTDAHLAAIAVEYSATLCSADNDFARFQPALRFLNPLQ
jgi:hypothetical protein